MTLTVRARESVGVERIFRLLLEWFIETITPSRSLVILVSLVITRIVSRLADIKLRVTHAPGFWLTVKRPLRVRIIIIVNIYKWLKIVILSLVKRKVGHILLSPVI